jgi:RimJ/RimL family protein N-acetyltransferase
MNLEHEMNYYGPRYIAFEDKQYVAELQLWTSHQTGPQIGYRCHEPGNGYMTQALLLALPLIPEQYRRLVIWPDNKASCRVAEKAGFVLSETLHTGEYCYVPKEHIT